MKTNDSPFSLPASTGLTFEFGKRVTVNSDGELIEAGSSVRGIGTLFNQDGTSSFGVRSFGDIDTLLVNANSDNIAPGAKLYAAANGRSAATVGSVEIGVALQAADADGVRILAATTPQA
jgi:hypothetical protein